jgi:uncharacterized membrane protein YoaK (UPF0700 family)
MRPATFATTSLGFVAGYVDTVFFAALFGLFTAHVTGNFVLIGAELARPVHGVLLKLLAFPAFIAGIALARMLALAATARGRNASSPILLLQALLLLASGAAGWRAAPFATSGGVEAIATGTLAAAAMGVQNAAGRVAWSTLTPTTVMTGNVTQFVIDLVDLLRGVADDALRQRLVRIGWPIVAFGAGAVVGGIVVQHLQMLALIVPLVILVLLAASSALEPDAPGLRRAM